MRKIKLGPRSAMTGLLLACVLLSGCEGGDDSGPNLEFDPATAHALNDKLMVDPDLANQNMGNAALVVTGGVHTLPQINDNPAQIRKAQEAAIAVLGGGSEMQYLPDAVKGKALPAEATLTAAALASSLGYTKCAQALTYSYLWAARLPENFPVYPFGNTKEAAGIKNKNCNIQLVTFITPVPVEDVLRFYFSLADKQGFSPKYSESDGEFRVTGRKGKSDRTILGRRLSSDLTEIDLVVVLPPVK